MNRSEILLKGRQKVNILHVANFDNIKSSERWSVSYWTFQVVTVAFNHGIDFTEKVYPEKQPTEKEQLQN